MWDPALVVAEASSPPDLPSPAMIAKTVSEITARMQAAYDALSVLSAKHKLCLKAGSSISSALRDIEDEVDRDSGPCGYGEMLFEWCRKRKEHRENLARGRAELPLHMEEFKQALAHVQVTYDALSTTSLSSLGLSFNGEPTPLPLQAAMSLVHNLLSLLQVRRDNMNESNLAGWREFLHEARDKRRKAPARRRYDAVVKKLSAALNTVIEVHAKTEEAHCQTQRAVYAVKELDEQRFSEPRKPSAEEVSRYLKELDEWSRLYLPAQRAAAAEVLLFRKHLLALEIAVKNMAPLLRKTRYLAFRATEPDVDAVVLNAREINDYVNNIIRNYRKDVEEWRGRKFDDSEPVHDMGEQEPEFIETLQLKIKNVGVSVANKCIAHAKYKEIRDKKFEDEKVTYSGQSLQNFSYVGAFDSMDSYLLQMEEVRARNDRQRAQVQIAYDAYSARCEMAREVSGKCVEGATIMERTLKPMSDQFRVVMIVVRKLQKLHGSIYASAFEVKEEKPGFVDY
ncbi:MAG: hypothetical protein K2W82_16670 [Candidatus Obscuribacterales bacterium]|nr:hypothetical protein [Candidatus Obscuribacterales bacterium]